MALTFANKVTICRILIIPFFIVTIAYYTPDKDYLRLLALGIFLLAVVTDIIDGYIARTQRQKTKAGAILDPLADKILLITAYITLAIFKMLPGWLAVLTISGDMIILLGVLVLFLNNYQFKVKPSLLSKATTCIQVVTILVVLLSGYMDIGFIKNYLFWMVAIVTVSSGLQYIRKGLVILSKGMNGDFA